MTTTDAKPCGLCHTTTYDEPCVSASGRHWTSLDGDDSPMPAALAAALTAPEHRTAEQAQLIADDSAERARRGGAAAPEHRHVLGADGYPSPDACARTTFRRALADLDLPATVRTCYGEDVDVNRYVTWLLDWDAPTLAAVTALVDAARAQGPR